MNKKFPEHKEFNLSQINNKILEIWDTRKAFQKSLDSRKKDKSFIFFEGPPSANGLPGIHHVMSRTIKDAFCRFKTMEGYHVKRKAGWDTHGLPVELSVEQRLGITKEDIGEKISVEEYNDACRNDVMKFTDRWKDLTRKMGYWINMDDPYITYDNKYIETVWYLLKKLHDKGLLYKGYTIQPYSPAAGTGLSSHELNQPGCYRDIKDTTIVSQFRVIMDEKSEFLFTTDNKDLFFLAWTTTPWTLPSNTALAVGKNIIYINVETFNPYNGSPVSVILAKDLFHDFFDEKNKNLKLEDFNKGDKNIPYKVIDEFKGNKLNGIRYEQLLGWVNPGENAFRVVTGDFVTTTEGTGIVHIAPTFGADDMKVAAKNNIPSLTIKDKKGIINPLVDRRGRFFKVENMDEKFVNDNVNTTIYKEFSGRFVKNEFDKDIENKDTTVDIDIAVRLKHEGKAFKIEKYVHNYPHCWRTDKPILYYPLDSWFVKSTAFKERMIELNKTINWKPAATGTGRFGKWLENLVDWNLSRSRFWGTPLPVWLTKDKKEEKCIGSVSELKEEIDTSVEAGFMKKNPIADYKKDDFSGENYSGFDLHRPFVDNIFLVSKKGKKMFREPDLIDGWFDSGSMPYAQHHYPFSMKDPEFKDYYPADFIAEGVDQTRGWFFTLHAIAVMLFDSVSFKNIISNGLVLDKNGNKMSKRLGNAVDPFAAIQKHGSDPIRWYLITNAQPWDNLKFDLTGLDEVKRKFFGTLYNTYSFFVLYANIDGFRYKEENIPMEKRPGIDRWIISLLNSLIKEVHEYYTDYEPTKAGRAIQNFVMENLSNWYVRLNRKRYWGGKYDKNKIAAYQTLYTCLDTVSRLAAPIAPFYMDLLFLDLNETTGKYTDESVHLTNFPKHDTNLINKDLEDRMNIAQKVSSMILGLRRKVSIKVRQPLNKIMIPVLNNDFKKKFDAVKDLILSEVNVKEVEYITDTSGILVKKIKPDFKSLGPRYGKLMKFVSPAIAKMSHENIAELEKEGKFELAVDGKSIQITLEDVEIISEDIPGWLVTNDGLLTVALDVTVTNELKEEGIAREFINRIQNLRKESGFNVTDKIHIQIQKQVSINTAIEKYADYIGSQTLALSVVLVENMKDDKAVHLEFDDINTLMTINKALIK